MSVSGPNLVVRLGLSVFGTGYAPKGGGTLASLAALPLAWFLAPYPLVLAGIVLLLFMLGVWGTNHSQSHGWSHDDPRITVDEFCGMLAASVLVPRPVTLWGALLILGLAFVMFRLLDIFKPPPVSLMERLPGGWGVMGDDLVAGIIANGFVQLTRLLPAGWLGGS